MIAGWWGWRKKLEEPAQGFLQAFHVPQVDALVGLVCDGRRTGAADNGRPAARLDEQMGKE